MSEVNGRCCTVRSACPRGHAKKGVRLPCIASVCGKAQTQNSADENTFPWVWHCMRKTPSPWRTNMHHTPFDLARFDLHETVSIVELSHSSGLSTGELAELVDYGALTPLASTQDDILFKASCVESLRKVCRLRWDYDLDVFTLAILLGYVERINDLERQIIALEASDGLPSDDTHH